MNTRLQLATVVLLAVISVFSYLNYSQHSKELVRQADERSAQQYQECLETAQAHQFDALLHKENGSPTIASCTAIRKAYLASKTVR
jgi:predicted negative regulator of RcsB-dependent stress response